MGTIFTVKSWYNHVFHFRYSYIVALAITHREVSVAEVPLYMILLGRGREGGREGGRGTVLPDLP